MTWQYHNYLEMYTHVNILAHKYVKHSGSTVHHMVQVSKYHNITPTIVPQYFLVEEANHFLMFFFSFLSLSFYMI